MSVNEIKLCNGSIAAYDPEDKKFYCICEIDGKDMEIALVADPSDENGIEAVKYTFSKLYNGWNRWIDKINDSITKLVLPFINGYGDEMTPEMFLEQYFPRKIEIAYSGDVHFGKPEGNKVRVTYEEFDVDEESFTFTVQGTLEEGFDKAYMNDQPMNPAILLKPHTLSTGDVVTYSNLMGAYEAELDFLGEEVECFFTPDMENHTARKAFELFETVYAKAEDYDALARKYMSRVIIDGIDRFRTKFNDPDLEAEDVLDDLTPVILVFDSQGTMDLAYETGDEDEAIRITVSGTAERFESIMIEDAEL